MATVKMCNVCRSTEAGKHGHYVVKVRQHGVGYGYYNSTGRIVNDVERATKYNEAKAFTMVREAFEDVEGVSAEVTPA